MGEHRGPFVGSRLPQRVDKAANHDSILPGASRNSQHLRNCAIDFKVKGMRPATAFDRLRMMRDAKVFNGGLGLYSTFVHIDNRGRSATW